MLGEGMLKKTNFKRQVKKQLQEHQVLNIDNFGNIVVWLVFFFFMSFYSNISNWFANF